MDKQDAVLCRVEGLVRQALDECGLKPSARIVVAVSGGPDSLALLYSLVRLQSENRFELHGSHLDHGLRGEASASDARYVAKTFRDLGIPITVDKVDVASYRAEHRLSLEEAARDVRYDFLAAVAKEQGANAIALGHTSDDQAETVLMHIIRGSGLNGLKGMGLCGRGAIHYGQIPLVRPLLSASRQDTTAYCCALGIEPLVDESNGFLQMTRNRVRMELLPLLEEINPQVRSALLRLSRSARQQIDYLDDQVDSIWSRSACVKVDRVILDRRVVNTLSAALRSHLLRRVIAVVKGDVEGVYETHIDQMARMIQGSVSKITSLPGDLKFHVGYESATLELGSSAPSGMPLPLTEAHDIKVPGVTTVDKWLVSVELVDTGYRSQEENHKLSFDSEDGLTARLSYIAVGNRLKVRGRNPGDCFQPLGMQGHKKLKDFLIDEKIPQRFRDCVPLLVSPRGIVWVAGCRISEWAKVSSDDGKMLQVTLHSR